MVTKVTIRDNTRSPLRYIADLEAFSNGREYEFKPGVNVIVGENGCGKTTLLNLIRTYLCVDYTECFRGDYNPSAGGNALAMGLIGMMFTCPDALQQRMKELEELKPYLDEIRETDKRFRNEEIKLSGFEW